MRLKSIAMGLCAVFLMCDQGYCLFREDVGAQQVQSAIKMQRAKDEQRKNEAEQVKQQTDNKEIGQSAQTYSAQTDMSASSSAPAAVTSSESVRPLPEYKRLTPQGTIVDTPQPVLVLPVTVADKTAPKKSNHGFVFLLLVLVTIGFITFNQKSNK